MKILNNILVKGFSLILILLCFSNDVIAQSDVAVVRGIVRDELNAELIGVNIVLMVDEKQVAGAVTDINGAYHIAVPSEKPFYILYSYIGFKRVKTELMILPTNGVQELNITMEDGNTVGTVEVNARAEKDVQIIKREDLEMLPIATGNLESILQFIATGVSSGTGGELTSQYSVRGGNYDENLIYVNGFEIYRPMLIRSSQQEGLSFPNGDLLESMTFSNGGFKAQYGDKMSSVLDITYRRPTEKIEGSVGASLLGGQLYLGGAKTLDLGRRLTWIVGSRYKTTKYLLNSQAVEGEYIPTYLDVQANIIWDITKRSSLEFIGNYSYSRFQLTPKSGSNDTGLFDYVLNLTSNFEGKEDDAFKTGMIGLAYKVASDEKKIGDEEFDDKYTVSQHRHKLSASYYESQENENIDIISEYWLTQKNVDLGSETFGEPVASLGYGMTHQYVRNYLTMKVANVAYRGVFDYNIYKKKQDESKETVSQYHTTQWSLEYKNESINDDIKEWIRYDSLYYTVPYEVTGLAIPYYIRGISDITTHRALAFLQHTWQIFTPKSEWNITGGVRGNYSSLNKEFVISPRMQLLYTPRRFSNPIGDSTKMTKDLTFKLALGAYHQPPLYRELRNLQGEINTDVLSQRSWQALGGLVWDFVAHKRRFKLISEIYYKYQYNLVPYDVENVRVRYYGDNLMSGYVGGIDLRLNGEFVKGLESWFNFSFMRARERFDDVQHMIRSLENGTIVTDTVSSVPKPTDQSFMVSMYFQDNFPGAEWARVNVGLVVGAGLPFGIPNNNIVYRNTYRYLPYHRVDIGFSFMLWNQANYIKKHFAASKVDFKDKEENRVKKMIKSAWLSIEVFNLMQALNQSSYTWIKTFDNVSYGIPNTLTTRRINVRLKVDF